MFIFHTLYEGKGKDHNEWREKVNLRISQTLKYLNSQRILKIIDYDPVKHLKKGQFGLNQDQKPVKKAAAVRKHPLAQASPVKGSPEKYQNQINLLQK